jgi:hypothetical protein
MKFAVISASSSGDNAIVAAVTGKKIRVTSYVLSFSGSVNAKWRSGTTDLSGLLYGAAAAVVECGPTDSDLRGQRPGHLETARGEALNLNLSGATAVGGHLTYEEIP